jgi:hypothetical protein
LYWKSFRRIERLPSPNADDGGDPSDASGDGFVAESTLELVERSAGMSIEAQQPWRELYK